MSPSYPDYCPPYMFRVAPTLFIFLLFVLPNQEARSQSFSDLPTIEEQPKYTSDWLLDNTTYKAQLYTTANTGELVLSNGLIARTVQTTPNGATTGLDNLVTGASVLRGVKPEAIVMIDSVEYEVGGLKGQPNYAYLKPEWVIELTSDSLAFQFDSYSADPIIARMPWVRSRHHDVSSSWPPGGIHLQMHYIHEAPRLDGISVTVHYALYDGIPAYSKWITVSNESDQSINIDRFTSEILAAVEAASWVETRGVPMPTPNIHVETDYSFGGMRPENASRLSVHWVEDPEFSTQVNYLRTTPALLEVRPTYGPDQTVPSGGTFESFRAFVLVYDSTEKERKGLALRRLYRTVAPWVTENPIMMHVRFADWENVKRAIDQAAEVGFEMVILTFGKRL